MGEGGDARPIPQTAMDKRKIKPTCQKCGSKHWFFVACEMAAEVNAREEARKPRPLEVVWRSEPGNAWDDKRVKHIRLRDPEDWDDAA